MRRTTVIVLALAASAAPTAAPARAAQLSYVDGGQIWVSTLDGATKRPMSGPSPGENTTWTEQAQSDDGFIMGVARRSGGTGAAAPTRVWRPDGTIAAESTLGYHAQYNSSGLAVPVQLDLTPGGGQTIYTYSHLQYGYPTSTLNQGTWVQNTSNSSGEPFDIPNLLGSSLVGTRWIGINGNAASDADNIVVGAAPGPFTTEAASWFRANGAWAVDAAANASVVAVIFRIANDRPYQLAMFASTALGAPLPGASCDMPTVGDVGAVSLSQDGAWVSWTDDRGLLVAPVPALNANPCPLAAAPTVISPTGSEPSIGATTLAFPPAPTPTPTPTATPKPSPTTGGGAPGTGTPSAAPRATVARTVKASVFAKGLSVTVAVRRAGTVTATARVGKTTLAKRTVRAKKAGTLKLTLKASRTRARRLARYRGKTLTLTVKGPGGTTTLRRKLR